MGWADIQLRIDALPEEHRETGKAFMSQARETAELYTQPHAQRQILWDLSNEVTSLEWDASYSYRERKT